MAEKLRVLILEDRQTDLEIVLHELRRAGFEPLYQAVANEADFQSRLDGSLDIILADYSLPQFTALEALSILKERGLHTPFIVVTGSLSEEAAVTCLKNGATDYLLKDRLARLGSAVSQALEARKNLEDKLAAEEDLHRRNRELTLLNRIIAVSAENTDERVFLQTACDELTPAIGAFQTTAVLVNVERTRIRVAAVCGERPDPELRERVYLFDNRTLGGAIVNRTDALVVHDKDGRPEYFSECEDLFPQDCASAALFPMQVNGIPAGALALSAKDAGHFNEERVALIHSVADQLSNALARVVLERELRRLSAAIDQASDAVIIISPASTIQYVNPAFRRVTGYDTGDVLGRYIGFLCGNGQESEFMKAVEAALTEGKEWRGRFANRKKNAERYTVDASFAPIRDKSGEIVSCVSVQRDISEELAMEEKYRQAQKMEAVGRLAGGVAHDFNNLLTAIMGYTNLLSERLEHTPQDQADLNEIRKAAERAANLTRQLLAFSRKQIFQPRVINLNTIVRDIKRMLQPLIGEDIELGTSLDPRLGQVRADPGQIEQVIMNLAVNARDAMPNGGKLILKTANRHINRGGAGDRMELEPGPYAVLGVSDTGTGLTEDVLPHVFEPFFTTKEEGKGTGLGLSTVYGIIRQSGGSIAVHSSPGKGTTFEIFLPRLKGEAVTLEDADERDTAVNGTENVLLVEDNEMVADLACKVLESYGYHVTTARHPARAIALAVNEALPLDLLITDMVMPGMSGRDLVSKISDARPGLRVLYISGYTDAAFINEEGLEKGSAFLQKPFTPHSLARAVRDLLDG